ncbi:MAG: ABC transporter transmembrane domain-containing protein, partial [Sporomusa sp.]
MEEKSTSGIGYLLQLAGRNKFLMLLSAIFSVFSSLCSFVPFAMVYRILMFLFAGSADSQLAIRYALTAALAITGKFVFLIISGTLSHIGAFNTLYSVRAGISRHIANVNLGFFTNHTSGEIKKVIIEDVERMEKFLAHQIPDLTAAICTPIIVFIYLLTIHVPMALCILIPVVLGAVLQVAAMIITGKQMGIYHTLLAKLNSTIMQFVNGMTVMKTYNMTAGGYKEYADTVTDYNTFWKRCTRDQGYTYGIFVA